ncbi:putative PLP-dependent enzyme possibly involved in cell wall biogenesis [Halovivax ruber XH-70]|uniref:Putative PLP-dependent enzyme possibly involved in cell wall biogenesis n=1 Tax=Halovivax ruber (strain DSM 18193 / JCM 13892 / XH-70) TaxID=797302 RepID=L0I7Q5_HALRX|nr:DegT/DnrJ/EryC1/StrS family aminotransferase [Halovivax ruber]AGB15625.1 putative PLP-dependent enzyme possibly involved in cell wall biogenesis [Halovivax ruber XH-70]
MIPIANPDVGREELDLVESVFESGMLADGPEVRRFETEFAELCDSTHAVATSNGTTALHTAMVALGLGPGDTVLTTPFSFVASANAIRLAGATPIFADIDPETYTLDPDSVRSVLADRDVDAILAVHLYGLPAKIDELATIADEHDITLIEDAAQAHGASYNGRPVGTFGDAACFSFYPTKNMTTGEGGIIVTDLEEVAEQAATFINHGRSDTYAHDQLGHNFRMTSVAAAIGRAQLEKLAEFTDRRRQNAAELTEALSDSAVVTPVEPSGTKHVYHQYTIRYEDRDGLQDHLDDVGVGTGVYYPTCIHNQPVYDAVTHSAPVAEKAASEVLSLPVHPGLSADDLSTISDAVLDYVRGDC